MGCERGNALKKNRHAKIEELICQYEIETQEELADRLREAGYPVTQATISRDIREMKLSKLPNGNGRLKYVAIRQDETHLGDKYIRVLKEGYISMEAAQNLLVIRTVAGMAMAVAAAVDALKLEEIVGCIAGDNTIMAAMRSAKDAELVKEKLQKMLEEL